MANNLIYFRLCETRHDENKIKEQLIQIYRWREDLIFTPSDTNYISNVFVDQKLGKHAFHVISRREQFFVTNEK